MRFCLLESPRLAAEVELDSGPERKRQSRIAERLEVMLAEQVLEVGVNVDARRELISAPEFHALVPTKKI